jgi:hypothetical protein
MYCTTQRSSTWAIHERWWLLRSECCNCRAWMHAMPAAHTAATVECWAHAHIAVGMGPRIVLRWAGVPPVACCDND